MTLFLPTNTHQYVRTLVASVSDVTGTDIKDVKLLFDVPRPAPKTVEEEEEREGEPAYVSCRVFSPVVATCRHPPELSDACARTHRIESSWIRTRASSRTPYPTDRSCTLCFGERMAILSRSTSKLQAPGVLERARAHGRCVTLPIDCAACGSTAAALWFACFSTRTAIPYF